MNRFNTHLIILFILMSSFLSNHCFAQSDSLHKEKPSRVILTFGAGMGLPLGEFAQFEQISGYAGYSDYKNIAGEAEMGISGNLGFGYLLGKHFGFTSSLNFSSFVSKEMITTEIFSGGSPFLSGVNATYENGRWSTGALMIGALYECSRENFRFGFKLMGGMQLSSSPETDLETVSHNIDIIGDNATIRNFHQPAMKSKAFAYGGVAYFGYNLTKALSLNLAADYSSANHTFDGKDLEVETYDVYSGSSSDPRYYYSQLNFEKKISFVSLTLELAYKL